MTLKQPHWVLGTAAWLCCLLGVSQVGGSGALPGFLLGILGNGGSHLQP